MAQSVGSLFMSKAESYFDTSVASMGVLPSIIEALNKYDFYNCFVAWFHDSTFPDILKLEVHCENESEKL